MHLIATSDKAERIAGTAMLCVDAALIRVLLALMNEPGTPPGPLLTGYPLIIVGGATFFHASRAVIVTIASLMSYVALLVAEPHLTQPVHYHVCFLIMMLAIAGCMLHQVRRVRKLSDYFESRR